MNHRFLASLCTLTAAAAVAVLSPIQAAGQGGLAAVEKAAASLAPKNWTPPRTPDGQPDIQGLYNNGILTPLERPAEFAGKPFFTPDEAAAFEKKMIQQRNADRRGTSREADLGLAYNDAWWDWGTKVAKTRQTSLVVDPPDGKVPPYTPEAQKRIAAKAQAIKERCEHTVCPPAIGGAIPADGPEDRTYMERCFLWSTGGPPMLPSAYNNNYQIVQTPDAIVIRIEMIHDVRIIPLDGRPHVSQNVRELMGDSRGHWEGNTLVVDTTNFSDETDFRNAGRNMHLTERFTRVDPDTILYEFTVDDPTTFTRPWSGAIPMTKTNGPIFEYACHEGNYGMEGILSGARAKEKLRAGSE
jgi:hypothetical protein